MMNIRPNASSALISRERSSIRWSISGALVASISSWLMPAPFALRALDLHAHVVERIKVRHLGGLIGHVVDLLLEVGKLGFAHRLIELVLEIARHAADLSHPVPERAERARQLLRSDRDQRDDAD